MSLAALKKVYSETKRLSVAGSNLARDDFRLKKLVEPLQKSAAKAPVFGQVAKLVTNLIEAPEKESPQALLDLGSLVTAILYTQGETDAKGTLKKIESTDLNVSTTQTSARLLKPLIEALTTTGSGRLKIIQDSFEMGAFQDLRLVNYAVKALDDRYSEIADFVTDNILPLYGKAIISLINDKIDIKGSGGSVRRLRLLYKLDPDAARPIVLDAFENGNKDMRLAALGCLGDNEEDLPHLQEQAKAKNKAVRQVAFERLSKFTDETTIELFASALSGKDRSIVSKSISQTKSKKLIEIALKQATETVAAIQEESVNKKLGPLLDCFCELLPCFSDRKEKSVHRFLADSFERRSEIFPTEKQFSTTFAEIESGLCSAILHTLDKKLLRLVANASSELSELAYQQGLCASRVVDNPAEVYEKFSPDYLCEIQGRSKAAKRAEYKKVAIRNHLNGDQYYHFHYAGFGYYGDWEASAGLKERIKKAKWDPRWIDAAIKQDHLDVVRQFADPKQKKKLKTYIEQRYERELKTGDPWNLCQVIELALDCELASATDMVLEALQKQARKRQHYYLAYWIGPLISRLDAKHYEKIEKVVLGMSENVIDELMPNLQTLRAKKK